MQFFFDTFDISNLDIYTELSGLSDVNTKSYFVYLARNIARKMMKHYGLTIFFVKEAKKQPIILGISRESILRMAIDTLSVTHQYMLSNIKATSVEEKSFSISFNPNESEQSYKCFTTEGEGVMAVIHESISKNMQI